MGRLGLITQLTLNIVPQQSVQRVEQDMTVAKFADQVKQVQDAYLRAKQTGAPSAVWTALHSLNETQVLFLLTCLGMVLLPTSCIQLGLALSCSVCVCVLHLAHKIFSSAKTPCDPKPVQPRIALAADALHHAGCSPRQSSNLSQLHQTSAK